MTSPNFERPMRRFRFGDDGEIQALRGYHQPADGDRPVPIRDGDKDYAANMFAARKLRKDPRFFTGNVIALNDGRRVEFIGFTQLATAGAPIVVKFRDLNAKGRKKVFSVSTHRFSALLEDQCPST